MPSPTAAPDRIGPYQVLRPIAQGGMAEVFEVLDATTGEHLALKLLVRGGSAGPRFDREYEALIRLNHPSIVRVYSYGVYRGAPWFTMEMLDGVPLQRWVKEKGRPGADSRQREVIRLGFLVADALQYLHERGIVHRDLKSANILVLRDGRVKLLDFGTAHIQDPVVEITEDGEFVGTFSYASPEQITGGKLDVRSDLYSLGVLLYRLATGQRPFDAANPAQIARMHVLKAPEPPSALAPGISPEVERLILWLMEKDPARRPGKAEHVAKYLEEIADRPLSVVSTTLVTATDMGLGREEEVRRIWSVVNRGFPGTVILLMGRDGCGRVGLAESVLNTAQQRGWRVALRTLGRRDPVAGLRQLFEDLDSRPSAGNEVVLDLSERIPDELELLERYAQEVLLHLREEGASAWLGLHHAHRLGPRGVALIHRLRKFSMLEKVPVYFLFTMEQDTSPEWASRGNSDPFPGAHRLLLTPLTPSLVAITAGALLRRRPPPPAVARRIFHATGGQPDYLVHLLRKLVVDGVIVGDDQHQERVDWQLAPEHRLVCEIAERHLRSRMRDLPASSRRLLELLSLAGHDLPEVLLASTMGIPVESFRVELQLLERLGWVELIHGTVRSAFPLAEELFREMMRPCRRRALARRLSEALQGSPPSLARVRLLLALGRSEDAYRLGLEVVQEQMDRRDFFGALDLLDALMERQDEVSDPTLRGEIALKHAQCMLLLHPFEKAAMRSLTLAEKGLPAGDVRVQLARAGLYRVLGHYPNHRKHLLSAWELLGHESDPRLSYEVAEELSLSFSWSGQLKASGEWMDKGGAVVAMGDDPVLQSRHALLKSSLEFKLGEVRKVEEIASSALRVLERAGELRVAWEAVLRWAESLRVQGRFSEALSILYLHVPEARREDVRGGYVRLGLAAAEVEVDLCRLGRAQEWVEELGTLYSKGEHLQMRLEADTVAGRIALESGQYFEAAELLERVYLRARTANILVTSETARALLAETLWHMGEYERAAEFFRSAVLGLLGTGDRMRLLAACVRQGRVMAEIEEPATIFAPVKEILESRPVMVAQLEYRIAQARWLQGQGRAREAAVVWREAAETLNVMSENLNDMDRSALRVHPWSTLIRRGLKAR
ncbi:MAG: serine/threonine protein kinase [Deltaproteobacteria bacterium]|nr:serine/threonine protein kinase [Deltaproteobacteria bacterium]